MKASLAATLRERTADLHREAERAGVMGDLLRGRCSRATYCALLRNLAALYEALEHELERQARDPLVRGFGFARLVRAQRIRDDLVYLGGPCAMGAPLSDAMSDYVYRLG